MRILRPSASKWARARAEAEVAQLDFENKHPEPYDTWQHALAVTQRAERHLHERGYRI